MSEIEQELENRYAEDYHRILDFKALPVGDKSLVFVKFFNEGVLDLPKFDENLSKEEILNLAVGYINDFKYSYAQNLPLEMLNKGEGNCQAMSLVLDTILETYGINSEVIVDGNHAYNLVNLKDKIYKLDMAKELIELEEVE